MAAGACERALHGHVGLVYALAVVGSRLASGSRDRSVRVSARGPGAAASPCEATLAGHGGTVNALAAWLGWLASGADDARIAVWDAGTGALEATLAGHEDKILGLKEHGDRLHSSSKDGRGVSRGGVGSAADGGSVLACGGTGAVLPGGERDRPRLWICGPRRRRHRRRVRGA